MAFPAALVPLAVPSGGERLIGCLYQAAGDGPAPTVLLLHGCPGYERHFDIAHALVRAGYHAAVVHYRGAWGSGGWFALHHVVEDAHAILDHLFSDAAALRIDPARIVPIGHSMGGFAALMLGAERPEVPAMGGFAVFNFGVHMRLLKNVAGVRERTVAHMEPLMPPLRGMTAARLVQQMERLGPQWNLLDRTAALAAKPLLLIGATDDETGPVLFHHRPLVQALEARRPARFTHLEIEAGHGFQGARLALTEAVIGWLDATLSATD